MTREESIAWNKAHPLQGLPEGAVPSCPACGSELGILGTSYAYFVCGDCKTERYWTPSHAPTTSWKEAVELSPWSKFHGDRDRKSTRLNSSHRL